jgi:excisionase family DNA binding protein
MNDNTAIQINDIDYGVNCYTISDVADLLKVKKSFVYELVYTGQLNSIRFSERRIRIPHSALEEFILKEMGKPITNNKVVQPPKRGRKPHGTV